MESGRACAWRERETTDDSATTAVAWIEFNPSVREASTELGSVSCVGFFV